jgi:hypothetical protein
MSLEPEEPSKESLSKESGKGSGNQRRASAAALIDAFAQQYQADRQEAAGKERHRIFREWLTIIGLFLAAIVAFFQWRELRSTDHNIAEQARTASGQLTLMQRQLDIIEREQQAKFSLVDPVPGPQFMTNPKGRIAWNLSYINSGKGEARNLTVEVYLRVGTGKFKPSPGLTFPSRHAEFEAGRAVMTTAVSQEEVTEEQFQILSRADGGIWTLIIFEYLDIFDKLHTKAFCLARLGGGGANAIADAEECKKEIAK